MSHDVQNTLAAFAEAVVDLLSLDALRYADPGERYVVAELFVRLRDRFPKWDVSNEYNRREQETKRLSHYNPASNEVLEADITPDLIIHHIGKRDNLLVVEVKRHVNLDVERDIWKLMGLTEPNGEYGYAAGVHLVVNAPAGTVTACDVYVGGALNELHTAWLRGHLP